MNHTLQGTPEIDKSSNIESNIYTHKGERETNRDLFYMGKFL